MNKTHAIILQGALKHITEGKTIQYRLNQMQWEDIVLDLAGVARFIELNYEIRVKPEPVFKEVAVFKHVRWKEYRSFDKDYVFTVPESWTRVSDWVKVEIKDDIPQTS